ncbi:MAG: ribonuclease D [Candidatus Puniceispirillales bacterium WSBS_2018_MAG_OTU23]
MSVSIDHIHLYHDDLPEGLDLGASIAIDTETMGLNPHRDRLCLVQISTGDRQAHLVKISHPQKPAPRLAAILGDENIEKIFHFARFDLAALRHGIGTVNGAVYCTKIASKLIRTYTDRHGLSELCCEILSIDLSKQQQSSDWGAKTLTPEQLKYAASDVLYLHQLKAELSSRLEREGRAELAQACFDFLPSRAEMDLIGFPNIDIFSH